METITQLEAAILAAGMATAYVADEWAAERETPAADAPVAEGTPTQH